MIPIRASLLAEAIQAHGPVSDRTADSDGQPRVLDDTQVALLAELVPDAAVVVDAAGTILVANERVGPLFGYSNGELVGMPIETLVPERFRAPHRVHRQGFVASPRARTMGAGLDLFGRRSDGTEVPVDISLAPLHAPEGLRVVAAIRDLSDRQAFLADQAQLAAVVNSSLDGIVSMSREGRLTSWNPGAEQLLGYAPAEILGRHVSVLVPPEHSEDLEVLLAAASSGKHAASRDTLWRRKDGSLADLAVSVSMMSSPAGSLIGFSAMLRDVTERKQAEAALKRLLADEQRRERQQSAMADIRLRLLSGVATDDVLAAICDHARDLFACDQVIIAGLEAGGLAALATSAGATIALRELVDDQLVASVTELSKAARYTPRDETGSAEPERPRVVLCAPVISDKRVVGLLIAAGDLGAAEQLYDADVLAAESLADQVALALKLETVRETRERLVLVADRERIARDLHDLVIQRLFAIGMMLQGAARVLGDDPVGARIDGAVDDLDATIREIRTVIFELGSPLPERSGLRAEVLELVERATSSLGYDPSVHFDGPIDTGVPPHAVPHLLAAIGEGLSNVARHARASRVTLELAVTGGEVRLVVEDDGVGIGDDTRSSGLANLRDRALALGGGMEVTSPPSGGTCLLWYVPA
jgi:PAS domain S-box-containing protein